MPPTYVASIGDAENPLTWSGIPYHLTEAGKKAGLVSAGLPMAVDGWPWRAGRVAWNLWQAATGDRRGGYQYSRGFLEALWRGQRQRVKGARVVNCFPLYAPSVVADPAIEKWFFIDLTLTQLFDYYLVRSSVGRRIAADAVQREREGYQEGRGVVVMSQFAASDVQQRYGIPAQRIHVVVPGANLEPAAYARWEQQREQSGGMSAAAPDCLRLVMVSTDWRRKGLDRLLRAIALGRREGLRVSLRVIGNARQDLPAELTEQEGIEWLGRISKRTDAARFLEAVADADLGCILSRYEAGGSVLREYHALGLGAFATTAGGMPDFMFPEASAAVPAEATDEELAACLVALGRDRSRVEALRAAAWRRRHDALWGASVSRLAEVMG